MISSATLISCPVLRLKSCIQHIYQWPSYTHAVYMEMRWFGSRLNLFQVLVRGEITHDAKMRRRRLQIWSHPKLYNLMRVCWRLFFWASCWIMQCRDFRQAENATSWTRFIPLSFVCKNICMQKRDIGIQLRLHIAWSSLHWYEMSSIGNFNKIW